MKELYAIAYRAAVIADAARVQAPGVDLKIVKERAGACLTDLLHACDRANVATDDDLPPIALATGSLLHTVVGFITSSPGPTSNEWARSLAQQMKLVEIEREQFMEEQS